MLIGFAKNDNRKVAYSEEDGLSAPWIEKELISLNIEVGGYLKLMKEDRRGLEEEQLLVETGSIMKQRFGSTMKNV